MKWIALTPIIILLAACSSTINQDNTQYRSVSYHSSPQFNRVIKPVVTTQVHYDPVTIVDESPIDVRTTALDFY
ncbi:MAG: hypothetical protein H0U57_06555 [Tatlockia sp.]|nr:hypothetical protein [Tatlockia sp.]